MKSKTFLKFFAAMFFLALTIFAFTGDTAAGIVLAALPVMPPRISEEFKQALGSYIKEGRYNYIPSEIRGSAAISGTSETTVRLFNTNLSGLGNSYWLTNQEGTAGQLSDPEAFRVDAIKFLITTATTGSTGTISAHTFKDLCMKATYKFSVSGKIEAEGYLYSLALPSIVWGGYTTASATAIDTALNPIVALNLPVPIYIAPNWSFDMQLTYTGVTVPSNTYWTCILRGIRQTPVK